MGAGAYLGGHAETEIVSAELQQARRESEAHPYVIQESLLEQLSKEGLSRDSAYRVVKLLSTSPNALISTAEEKVYGLASGLLANPVTDGIVMGVAFMVGALVPLLPYFFIPERPPRTRGGSGSHRNGAVHRRIFRRMDVASRATMALGNPFHGDRDECGGRRLPHRIGDLAVGSRSRLASSCIDTRRSPHFSRTTKRSGSFPRRRKARTIAIASPRWSACSRFCGPRSARLSSLIPMILLPCVIVNAHR